MIFRSQYPAPTKHVYISSGLYVAMGLVIIRILTTGQTIPMVWFFAAMIALMALIVMFGSFLGMPLWLLIPRKRTALYPDSLIESEQLPHKLRAFIKGKKHNKLAYVYLQSSPTNHNHEIKVIYFRNAKTASHFRIQL